MGLVKLMRINSDRTRRIVKVFLVVLGFKYLALLITMYAICPRSSHEFLIFATVITASLAGTHFIKRLNWFLVMVLVALPVWPFSGNMFLFLDGMKRRAEDLPLLHSSLSFIQSVSIFSIAVCISVLVVGTICGGIIYYLDSRSGR
jgi:hypothetical protein